MQRLNKEFKLNISDNISLKYGTVNKDNPQVVYLSGKCWIEPTFKADYFNVVDLIKKEFKHKVSSFVLHDNVFSTQFILDFDLDCDNLKYGKKKFTSFNIFFKQLNNNPIKINDIVFKTKFDGLINDFLNLLISNEFSVSKSK